MDVPFLTRPDGIPVVTRNSLNVLLGLAPTVASPVRCDTCGRFLAVFSETTRCPKLKLTSLEEDKAAQAAKRKLGMELRRKQDAKEREARAVQAHKEEMAQRKLARKADAERVQRKKEAFRAKQAEPKAGKDNSEK